MDKKGEQVILICDIMMMSLPLDFHIILKDVIQNSPLIRKVWVKMMRKTEGIWAIENSFRICQCMFGVFDNPYRHIQKLSMSM